MLRIILLLLVASCATKVKTVSKFDEEQFKKLLSPGKHTVSGSALIRQRNGGVVTCAGGRVALIPVTEYSKERIVAIYGNEEGGYTPVEKKFIFEPDVPGYHSLARSAMCDTQGFFKFENVLEGEYYVTTAIVWHVSNYLQSGGGLARKVKVDGSTEAKVTLAP